MIFSKLSQGGQVGYEYLLIVAVIAVFGSLYLAKKNEEKPKQEIQEIKKEVDELRSSIDSINDSIATLSDSVATLKTNQGLNASHLNSEIKEAQDHIGQISGAVDLLQEHISRARASQSAIIKRIEEMPSLIDIRLNSIKKIIPIEIQNAKFVSKSWIDYERRQITGKNGKLTEKLVPVRKQYMKSVDKKEEPSKFKMPGVNESKMAMKKAEL